MPNLFNQKHGKSHYSFPIFISIFKSMAAWDDNDQMNVIAGFRTTGVYPFNRDIVKSKAALNPAEVLI